MSEDEKKEKLDITWCIVKRLYSADQCVRIGIASRKFNSAIKFESAIG